jgi:hypothetical protein
MVRAHFLACRQLRVSTDDRCGQLYRECLELIALGLANEERHEPYQSPRDYSPHYSNADG